jgi:hypothetical protein
MTLLRGQTALMTCIVRNIGNKSVSSKVFGHFSMEQCTLKNVNSYLNTNIYSYLETSSGQSSNLYLFVVHFFNTSVN